MLSPTFATIRLFLHVLGATIWVGGQIVMAGLVPGLRAVDEKAPKILARRFNLIAWSGFGLLFVTGVWNLLAIDLGKTSTAYQITVALKLAIVALSGTGAALHTLSKSRAALAAWGAIGGVSSLAALFFGVMLVTANR